MNPLRTIHAVALSAPVKQSSIRQAMAKALKAYTDVGFKTFRDDFTPKEKAECMNRANIMYRLALPPLGSYEEIHAYIACIAQGVAMGIFSGRDGSQLLYAAQVALSVVQLQRKESGNGSPKSTKACAA